MCIIVLLIIGIVPASAGITFFSGERATISDGAMDASVLPLAFIENNGQAPDEVLYHASSAGRSICFGNDGIIIRAMEGEGDQATTSRVVIIFAGSVPETKVLGIDPLPGNASFFLGADCREWRTGVPTYKAIRYSELYPGIDLVFRGDGGALKREFVLAPGSNPGDIVLRYSGMDSLSLTPDGDLLIVTGTGILTDEAPFAYQDSGTTRIPVEVKYTITDGNRVGFILGSYDPALPLVIDPTLKYSSYLGGTGGDFGYGITTDGSGNIYVTGYTTSTDFTVVDPFQANKSGAADIFITKLNPAGSQVLSSTYLGGSGDDYAWAVAVDGDGNICIAGRTRSTDFPVSNPVQSTSNGGNNGDMILAKLNPSGSALLFSTYLGGSNDEMPGQYGNCLAVDAGGNMYVTGGTNSNNYPVANAIQGTNAGGFYDVFITKVDPETPSIVYSTYLGGNLSDSGADIAVDSTGAAYITGQTNSVNFPLSNPVQPALAGSYDAFYAKINPEGSALVYSSYLGGSGSDIAYSTALGPDSGMYLTGSTSSANFTLVNPVQGTIGGSGSDAFVARVNPAGSALVYSTYLGGAGNSEGGRAIAVDPSGCAYIAGTTNAAGFPTVNPVQGYGALRDSFVTKLNPEGNGIVYSTYLGGSNNDDIYALTVDGGGNALVTGMTQSTDFPTVSPLQAVLGGGSYDGFIAIIESDRPPVAGFAADQTSGPAPLTVRFTDLSTGAPATWSWDFGDGSTSSDQNPEHQFAAPGTYSVSLEVTNALGSDSQFKQSYILVTDGGGPLPSNNQVFVKVGNDLGARFDVFSNDTYYVNFAGPTTGLNDVHISTDPAVSSGQVTATTAQSGVFYVTNTGSRTYKDDLILMIAVNGTLPDDFSVRIRSSGYGWTPLQNAAPDIGEVTYSEGAVDETFTRADFVYGPQSWKPAGAAGYPLLDGEDLNDPSNTYRILFVDTRVGVLGTGFENLTDRGAAKIEYTLENLGATAAFNAYTYCYQTSNGDTMIAWTNKLSASDASGYSVSPPRAPDAGFTANVTSGPAPLSVKFTDTSLYLPTGWSWTFGDGSSSSEQNPEHTYADPGTYNVRLEATNSLGSDTRLVTGYITVSEGPSLPNADFTANVTSGPVPFDVRFTDTSSGVPSEWHWEFGDGSASDEQNPVHTYTEAGEYTVNLTVNNTFGGDFSEKSSFITANPPLPVTWTVGATGCDFTDPDSAFSNEQLRNGDTISISPGSYTFSTGLPRSVTLRGQGADLVTLTMNSGSNLYFSANRTVVEGITFRANSKILYLSGAGSIVRDCTFDAIPTSANIYLQSPDIRVEDCTFRNCAVQNILVLAGSGDVVENCTFTANTNRIIQISGEGCLIANSTFRDNVQGSTVKGVLRLNGCKDLTVTRNQFRNNVAPGGVISLNGVSTGNEIYLNNFIGNSLDVKVDSGTTPVAWISPVPVSYTFRGEPFTAALGNHWGAYTGADSDGDGIGDAVFTPVTGQSDFSPLMDEWQYYFGATHPLESIIVSPSSAEVLVSGTMQFTAVPYDDTGAEMSGTAFTWGCNDTNVGAVDGSGLFTARAAGTARVIATNGTVSGSAVVQVTDLLPVASFATNVTNGPRPLTVMFNDTSSNVPVGWYWEFGDGSNSTSMNCSHTYGEAGTYTVSLTATNTAGSNTTTTADLITVNQRPIAEFSANTTRGKFPLTVRFTDESTNLPTSWEWDFGDGIHSSEQNPVHTYVTVGQYDVALTASNGDGSDTVTTTGFITVRDTDAEPLPAPRNIFVYVANDEGVRFNLDGPAYDGPNNTYYIKAEGGGLGAIHVSNDPEVIFGQVTAANSPDGTFYITNTGGRGYDDEIVLLLSVQDSVPDDFSVRIRASGYQWDPIAADGDTPTDYAYVEGAEDETFTKDDFIYGLQTWKPGPGDPVIPTHPLYVGQNISDPSTASYLMFVDLNVGNLKQSAFATPLVDKGAVKVEYTFTNMTTKAAFNGYGWCLISNQDQGISWTNDVEGISASGYSVDYLAPPVSEFSANTTAGTVPLTVAFTDASANTPTSWAWDFGDGGTSEEQNPIHTYESPGTYTVNLTATNAGGSDSEEKTGYINVVASGPRTWTVGASECDFTALDDAFANPQLNDGDTIAISPGAYTFSNGLSKQVTLSGAGADQVTVTMNSGSNLDFTGAGTVIEEITFSANSKILYISGDGSLIRDCTFGAIPTFANIYIQSADTRVENCTFQNCAVQNILVLAGSGDVVRNCTFLNNTNRIVQVSGSDCRIEDSIFSDNPQITGTKGIIRMQSTANLTVTGNRFLNNTAPGGVISLKSVSVGNAIYRNDFIGNTADVVVDGTGSSAVTWVSPSTDYLYQGSPFTGVLGNYYSSYSGEDLDGNGILDAARVLGTGQSDIAPLAAPCSSYTSQVILPPIPFPGKSDPPTDPDGDGIIEDMNGNGFKDFNDVVLFFKQMEWVQANEPVSQFDFNGNGFIDFNDIVRLFKEL